MKSAILRPQPLPLAVSGVSRQTEYGLAFYRDQIIERYESGEIPATEHLVVAPEGSQTAIAKKVAGRRVSYLGSFAPQGLDYYWVAAGRDECEPLKSSDPCDWDDIHLMNNVCKQR